MSLPLPLLTWVRLQFLQLGRVDVNGDDFGAFPRKGLLGTEHRAVFVASGQSQGLRVPRGSPAYIARVIRLSPKCWQPRSEARCA